MPGQERCELRFHRLLNQSFRAGSQNSCQGIVNFVWLTESDNPILTHGVTLLWEVRDGSTPTLSSRSQTRPDR
jgi:hypothetical protein